MDQHSICLFLEHEWNETHSKSSNYDPSRIQPTDFTGSLITSIEAFKHEWNERHEPKAKIGARQQDQVRQGLLVKPQRNLQQLMSKGSINYMIDLTSFVIFWSRRDMMNIICLKRRFWSCFLSFNRFPRISSHLDIFEYAWACFIMFQHAWTCLTMLEYPWICLNILGLILLLFCLQWALSSPLRR
jgi:hypothetical protein